MNLVFHPAAQEELWSATEYYDAARPGLGDDFAAAVEARLHDIIADPTSWEMIGDDVRRARILQFPYDLLFSVSDQSVLVLAIMHHHRRPRYWKYRTRR